MTDQYATIAEEYQRARQHPWRRHVEEHTYFALLGDLAGKRVLDLACGEGHYTRRLRQRGAARVVGVDLSPEMIRLAQAEEARRPLGLTYHVANAARLDLGETFDLVVATYLLNYARTREELAAMCQSVARHLAPGCRFVTANSNLELPLELGAVAAKQGLYLHFTDPRREGDPVHIRLEREGETVEFDNFYLPHAVYEEALHAAGFRTVRWPGLQVSPEGTAEHGRDYWADFLTHRPIVFLEAVRA